MSLSFERWGKGSSLLLLHGFTGSRRSWDPVRNLLEGDVHALAVDLPGHGESPLPQAPGKDGFLSAVHALAQTLDAAGEAQVDILGYSQGARLALGFAVQFPNRVRRLILESGTPGLHRRRDRAVRRAQDERLAQRIIALGTERFVEEWEALPMFAGVRRLPDQAQVDLRARRQRNQALGLASSLRSLGVGAQPDYWPELVSLRAPTLLLAGAEDTKFSELARRMAVDLPSGYACIFENAGHAPHLEVPAAWAQEVRSFLRTPWFDAPAWSLSRRNTLNGVLHET